MSITLYFAKLNLISGDVFDLYNDPKQKDNISFALYEAVKSNTHWSKENIFFDDDCDWHTYCCEHIIYIEILVG